MFDSIAIITNIGVIGYLIFTLFKGGPTAFSSDYIFIGYLVITILTLPMLISKVIFKSRVVGLLSALSYLIYPLQIVIISLFTKVSGMSMGEILPFVTIFNMLLWNILFAFLILFDEKRGDYSEVIIKNILCAIIPGIIVTVITAIFIRQKDSIVALDYLQHSTVPNKMFFNNITCLLPGQCSNLFLQHGYTTFYHTILGNITTFLQNDPIRTFYVIDILYPVIASIPLYYLFKKYTRSTLWSQLGVLLSLLVFVMGGYDFIFFIPQTFALLLFLMILKDRNLSLSGLILSSILLLSTHFVMGVMLAGFLWFKFLVIENLNKKKEVKIFYLILGLTVLFFALANIAGFSVEKFIQNDATKVIGSLTNPYYPNNIKAFGEILGPIWLLVILAYITNTIDGDDRKSSMIGISFIALCSIAYFLAPTYANKFTMGIGVYSVILIIPFILKLRFNNIFKLLLLIILPSVFIINFYIQYKNYLSFYTQSNGTVSAITKEDKELVSYLKTEKPNKIVLSDPYTQLVVASLANVDTAQAQYMQLETREDLYKFLKNPITRTHESLLNSKSLLQNNDFDLIYSSRLHRSLQYDSTAWINNIYSLDINSNEKIDDVGITLKGYLSTLGKKEIYISDYHRIFK